MKNKGFTLIEILATITILGIVLLVGVVSISRYIEDSRLDTYIKQANKNIDNLSARVTRRDYSFKLTDTTYYFPVKCISKDDNFKTAFNSKIVSAYVVVTYDGKENNYYYTQLDEDKKGILLTYRKSLNTKRIEKSVPSINLNVGVGDRKNIIRYPDNCSNNVINTTATRFIADGGSL